MINLNNSGNNNDSSCEFHARLEAELANKCLYVKSLLVNMRQEHSNYSYTSKFKRTGKAGVSISKQSGLIKAGPGEILELSRSVLSFSESDQYELHLIIHNDKQEVAEDAVYYPDLKRILINTVG